MSRKLHIKVFRYNPLDPASVPHMQSFYVEEYSSMTLFIALNIIREQQDPSLQFDFCCRAGICGSCGMVINGRPGLACHTQTRDLPDHIVLHPLPVFKLLGDLSVDTGVWFREVGRKIEAWVHTQDKAFDPRAEEKRMENELAKQIFELDRCIECGCCIAACGTARCAELPRQRPSLARFTTSMRQPFRAIRCDRQRSGRIRLHGPPRLRRRLPQEDSPSRPARHHAPYAGPQVRQGHPAQGPVRKVQGLRFALP